MKDLEKNICPSETKRNIRFITFIALALALTASFVFLYSDLVDMVHNSILLLRAIKEGQFFNFYTYTLENCTSNFSANYDFPIYLIFAIWNFPVACLFDYQVNGFVYLWSKGLIIVFIVVCAWLLYKIHSLVMKDSKVSKDTYLILLLTSPLVFLSEFIACQYDCISMAFILAGIYAYMKGQHKVFILYFCLAMPIKSFAIFMFIPLLAYREKNVIKIILQTGCLFLIPLVCKLLFGHDAAYSFMLAAQNRDAIKLLTNATIHIGTIEIHGFILAFLLICFGCYFLKFNETKVIWICSAVYTLFIILVPIRSYWVFLAEPFLLLLEMNEPKHRKVNFLIHTIAQISGSIYFLFYHGIYNSGGLSRSLGLIQIFQLPDVVRYGSFSNLIQSLGLENIMPLFRTVFIGCNLVLLGLNLIKLDKYEMQSQLPEKVLIWIRTGTVLFLMSIIVFVETFPSSMPVIDTLDYSQTDIVLYRNYNELSENQSEADNQSVILPIDQSDEVKKAGNYFNIDINAGGIIEQIFHVKDTTEVSKVSFQCNNMDSSRWNRGRIEITLVNKDTNEIVAEKIIGSSLIITGDIYTINLGKTILKQGKYCIRIRGIDTYMSGSIYVMCNTNAKDVEPAYVNGKKMDCAACICVH